MKNKQVKQMMCEVENNKQGIDGFKDIVFKGFHGFNESGLFHCSGSNFLWVYSDVIISLTANQLRGK